MLRSLLLQGKRRGFGRLEAGCHQPGSQYPEQHLDVGCYSAS